MATYLFYSRSFDIGDFDILKGKYHICMQLQTCGIFRLKYQYLSGTAKILDSLCT